MFSGNAVRNAATRGSSSLVRCFRASGILVDRQQAVRALVPHLGAGRLVGLDDAEGAEKLVQLGRVIEVARVFVEQLPVGADRVALVAGDRDRPGEHRREPRADCRAQIVFRAAAHSWRRSRRPRRPTKRRAAAASGAAPCRTPRRNRRRRRGPFSQGTPTTPARPVVAPVVVDAGEAARVATRPAHHLRAAMGAAVDEGAQRSPPSSRTSTTGVAPTWQVV